MSNQDSHKPGYKHTPLGWIPEEWQIKQVGDVCDFIVPGRNKPTRFDGEIPWITTPDLEGKARVFSSKTNLKISKEEAKMVGSKIVPKDAVIMSCVGELGLLCIAGNELVLNQQLHAFIPQKEIDHTYLFFALGIRKNFMERVATKTAVPYLNKDNCNSIPIFIPQINEQRRIAAILSIWDEAITKTQQLIAQLQQRNKGLMQQLLTGKKRLKGFEGEWKKISFNDCFEFVKSYPISRDGLSQENNNTLVYCIHYGDIHALYKSEFLDFSTQERIPHIINSAFSIDEKDLLKEGDIIIADASEDYEGVGEAVEVLNLNGKRAVGGLHTIVVRDTTNTTTKKFRAFLFASEVVRNELRKKATGTSVYSVTKSTIKSLHFSIPKPKEQQAIADVLYNANNEVKLYEQKLVALQQQKKGLMQKLLTGEIRVR